MKNIVIDFKSFLQEAMNDLSNVNTGDKIILVSKYNWLVSTVAKATKTRLDVFIGNTGNIEKYRRNGSRIGGYSDYYKVLEYNDENKKEMEKFNKSKSDEKERSKLADEISKTYFKLLSVEALKEIKKIIDKEM
jgi:hypothetical protein